MRGLISNSYWVVFVTLSALGLTGCNTESGGSSGPSIQTDPFFCAGGVCSLARGVALNEEYATTVQDELALGNVILKAANGSELTLAHAIEWDSEHSLTLQANNDIRIQGGMTATSGKLIIDNSGHEYTLVRPINLSSGQNFRVNGEDYIVITELGDEGSLSAVDLQGIDGNLAVNYALGSNIDATATRTWNSGSGFQPLGKRSGSDYSGTLEGLGHVINDLYINGGNNNGLFGVLSNATIKHLALMDFELNGGYFIGAFAGTAKGSVTISRSCAIGGTFTGIQEEIGGFIGRQDNALTLNDSCVLGATLKGKAVMGGFVGNNSVGPLTVEKSYVLRTYFDPSSSTPRTQPFNGGKLPSSNLSFFNGTRNGNNMGVYPGMTALANDQLSQISFYTESQWDISDDPDSHSLWYLDTTQSIAVVPMLRTFDVNLTIYMPTPN